MRGQARKEIQAAREAAIADLGSALALKQAALPPHDRALAMLHFQLGVATVAQLLYNLTEPLLRPIRQRLPSMGGLDISPIVLLLGIFLLQRIIVYYLYPNVF